MTRATAIQRMREDHVRKATHARQSVEAMKDAMAHAIVPGMPTIKATATSAVKPLPSGTLMAEANTRNRCAHEHWIDEDKTLKRCKRCNLLAPRKATLLRKLLPILAHRIFPPCDPQGRYYNEVIINDYLKLRRTLIDAQRYTPMFTLFVKFPRKWLWTMVFTEFQFDQIIRAIDPLLQEPYSPKKVYRRAQKAIYGRCWETAADFQKLM